MYYCPDVLFLVCYLNNYHCQAEKESIVKMESRIQNMSGCRVTVMINELNPS